MFGSLRQGMPLYVLNKSGAEPKFDIVEVISRTEPAVPNYGTGVYNPAYPMQKAEVNVSVRFSDGEELTFQKLPSDATIADCKEYSTVVSESRDAMLAEISTLQRASANVLESVDKHKRIVELCDQYIADLNPQIKQDAERSKEIESLRGEVNELRGDMIDIKGMLAKALNNRKSKED